MEDTNDNEKKEELKAGLLRAAREEVREELLRHFTPDAPNERMMLLSDVQAYLMSCGLPEHPVAELRELLRAEGFGERVSGGRLHFVMGEREGKGFANND